MSINGNFRVEDLDIVTLESGDFDGERKTRSGWVNIGPHAVLLKLNEAGDLSVEGFARANEGDALASCQVTCAVALAAGGMDPDHDWSNEA